MNKLSALCGGSSKVITLIRYDTVGVHFVARAVTVCIVGNVLIKGAHRAVLFSFIVHLQTENNLKQWR